MFTPATKIFLFSLCATALGRVAPSNLATVTGVAASAPTTPPSTAVGKTPALGWNSWNAYRCGENIPAMFRSLSSCISISPLDISESRLMLAANAFVSLGLKDVGYQYVNIDVRRLKTFLDSDLTLARYRIVGLKRLATQTQVEFFLTSLNSRTVSTAPQARFMLSASRSVFTGSWALVPYLNLKLIITQ